MPGSMKRTRSSSQQHDTENAPPTPTTPTLRPTNRRGPSTATPPTPELTTPTRPILTRSATMAAPPTPLTRSSSLLSPLTRRSNLGMGSGSMGSMGAPATPTRGGMLLRTQSTPSIASPSLAQMKDLASAGTPGTPGLEKGENEGFGFGRGGRRWGRGKENVPPKKEEEEEGNARKRSRVGSFSSRARSGSVSSMASIRSESRMPSVAPSGTSFGRRTSRVSPSPSLSSATSYSFESTTTASSSATFESDLDATPTKRPLPNRRARTLPTPPPSSPLFNADVDITAQRFGLVRMQSDTTEAGDQVCYDTEVDEEVPLKKKNPYKVLKSFLRLSGDQEIVGREEEKASLMGYLNKGSEEDVGVYVSGPPGTGKTATVMGIGRELRKEGWKVIELGCMGMKVGDVWKSLGEALGCVKTEDGVRDHLSTAGKTLIVLDEIDSLLPPPPTVAPPTTSHMLSKLFTLPLNTTTKLISISNTLDLTVRARLTLPSNLQPLILPFRAYSGMDMTPIITSRIDTAGPDAAKIDLKAVELLTRKIEASNGDLRTCLGVLTAAVSLAENEWLKKVAIAGDDVNVPLVKIVMTHTIKAFTNHTSTLKASAGSSTNGTSPTTKKVQSVQIRGKMVLVSILVFLARARAGLPGCPTSSSSPVNTPPSTPTRGVEQLTTGGLYATYVHLLSHHASPFPPGSESDYRDLMGGLEVLGLVGVGVGLGMGRRGGGGGGAGNGGKVELLVREEEVVQGLGLGGKGDGKGLAEEEVRKIWEREEGRVKRGKERMTMRSAAVEGSGRDVEMGS